MQSGFSEIGDSRRSNLSYPLLDLLNLGFAMFHLKDGSMSSFKEQYSVRTANLARIYVLQHFMGILPFEKASTKCILKAYRDCLNLPLIF